MPNKNKQLFGISKPEWYIEEASGCLHTFYTPFYANMVYLPEEFPYGHKILISIIRKDIGNYIWEMNDCWRLGREIFESLLEDNSFLDPYYKKWQQYRQALKIVQQKITDTDLAKLDNSEFPELFSEFVEAYMREYSLPLTTNSFGFYAEKRLREILGSDFNKYFAVLSSPTEQSFNARCELSLLAIADLVNKKSWADKEVEASIANHVKNYHWVENSYLEVKYLGRDKVVEAVKERLKNPEQGRQEIEQRYQKVATQQEKILRELAADRESRLLVKWLGFFVHWQDQRKGACLEALRYQYQLLREIVRRTTYTLPELRYTMHTEIEDILQEKIARATLQKRRQKCLIYMLDDKQLHFYMGEEAQKIIDLVMPLPGKVSELTGTVASMGKGKTKIKGKAVVAVTSREADNFEAGDILVTSMTRPDMVPLLKKAKAIITNEGGVTCHAAVVSRELGIPCIIGTKVATRVLRDGDEVEMDLKKGIIKKL